MIVEQGYNTGALIYSAVYIDLLMCLYVMALCL